MCIVITNYYKNMYYGVYSSLLNARRAIINFFKTDNPGNNIVSWEDAGDYTYTFKTADGNEYWITITTDTLDYDID